MATQQHKDNVMSITQEDIAQLVREPSKSMRAKIAQKISRGYVHGGYTDREVELAIEIFRLLLRDTERQVRKVLAEELKHSMDVPHDIIMTLAEDHIEIAAPILQFSYVLAEEDMIQIVEATREVPRLMAIASRESISLPLSNALINTGENDVVKRVLRNKGAMINDDTLSYIVDEYYNDDSVLEELVYRGGLPFEFAEKLFTLVSDELKSHLTRRYRLSTHLVEEATETAKDVSMTNYLSPLLSQKDVEKLVTEMYNAGKLDYSILVRALCVGNIRFFETAMAKLVGIPTSNAKLLMMDPGALGFDSIYASSPLPIAFKDAIKRLFDITLEETNAGKYKVDDFAQRVVQRIEAEGYDKTVENMPYLMSIVSRGVNEQHTIH